MRRSEPEILREALLHLDKAQEHAAAGLSSDIVIDATAMRLMALLDTLGRLPEVTLERMFGDDWPDMRGLRNRLVHGYATVDPARLANTMMGDLDDVRWAVEARLAQSSS